MSPLRDVAGMLRSFAYAAAMAGDGRAREPAGAALVQRYLDGSRDAFLTAYAQAAATIPHQWSQPDAAATLIDLFALEKAAYEIVYEAANRPAWLAVPLRGLGAARFLGHERRGLRRGARRDRPSRAVAAGLALMPLGRKLAAGVPRHRCSPR